MNGCAGIFIRYWTEKDHAGHMERMVSVLFTGRGRQHSIVESPGLVTIIVVVVRFLLKKTVFEKSAAADN